MKRTILLGALLMYTLVAGAQPGYQLRHISGNGQTGQYPNAFNTPRDLLVGPGGQYLYIADTHNDVIQVWHAPSMKPVAVIGRGQLRRPQGLSFDPYGRLWVADTGNRRLVAYDVSKPIARQVKTISKGMQGPRGLAFDRYGRLLIADTPANQILVMMVDQSIIVKRLGFKGSAVDAFNRPQDVSVDIAGNIYISDTGNQRIKIYGPELQLLKILGSANQQPFKEPKYLANDKRQRLYIADQDNNRVVVLDAAHNLVWQFGGTGSRPSLRQPEAVYAAGEHIWIADTGQHRIVHLQRPTTK